jgi:alkaline phosphatase D
MSLSRRDFLQASMGAASLAACRGTLPFGAPDAGPFLHGVASGDPGPDRVILWTRVTPEPGRELDSVAVTWRLARDPQLRDIAAQGVVDANPARDHTVKLDPVGLEPGAAYWYQFEARGSRSPIGRTRTLPVGRVERVRLGFCSCANLPQGHFNAYGALARRNDLDAVLHLGDYLYEYGNGEYGDGTALGRVPEPAHEIVSLGDYRRRHAQYKRDPELQELHRQHAVVAVWDDHESANNSWMGGAENHGLGEGDWQVRKRAAIRAYLEWMPVREMPGAGSDSRDARIYRGFRFGDLADLWMLDTRLVGRSAPLERDLAAPWDDPNRSLLGAAQEAWLLEQLSRSAEDGVGWRVLGQQVFFSPLAMPGKTPNPDAWDGYPVARARLLDRIERDAIENVVVLTGDIHSSWALDVARTPFDPATYDRATGRGSLAVEFVAPAVSSSALGTFPRAVEAFRDAEKTHPHLHWLDMDRQGYGLLDLERGRAQGEWWFVETVREARLDERFARAFRTRAGRSHLEPVVLASRPRADRPPCAP